MLDVFFLQPLTVSRPATRLWESVPKHWGSTAVPEIVCALPKSLVSCTHGRNTACDELLANQHPWQSVSFSATQQFVAWGEQKLQQQLKQQPESKLVLLPGLQCLRAQKCAAGDAYVVSHLAEVGQQDALWQEGVTQLLQGICKAVLFLVSASEFLPCVLCL